MLIFDDGIYFQLLSEPKYQCIEKIKSIGETYMAAAGIKPDTQVYFMLLLYMAFRII